MRESTLLAWKTSPTRLREDAATESDLIRAGYRDRLLTELAQNAADAAARSGVAGSVRVLLEGRTLRVSNTGAPLDTDGVVALSALRSSSKTGESVGRFGVGFTAVLSVSDDVELRSTSGSIAFSAERTRAEIAASGLPVPDSGPPVLRLVWPSAEQPRDGAASEVVLRLRDDVDADQLLRRMTDEAVDLLLELPALESIRVGSVELRRTERPLESGLTEVTIGEHVWWQYRTEHARWVVQVRNGVLAPVSGDVLRAPTRSDEELSIPAIVVADVAMQPDRRRVLPGGQLSKVAWGYADFVAAVPPTQRPKLVPVPGFPRSEVDSVLRDAILRELGRQPWVPTAAGTDVVPARAAVVSGAGAELVELLESVVGGLVPAELSGRRHVAALAAVDVHHIGLTRIAEILSGSEHEPEWWRRLYAALEPLVHDGIAAEELAAIPVPLSDGRTVTGPRTVVLGPETVPDAAVASEVDWARLVHPAAAHPLLTRLGAEVATAADLLSDPALRARIEEVADDYEDTGDTEPAERLTAAVTALAVEVPEGTLPSWTGQLLLRDEAGDLRPADELLLPHSPLARVLVADSPFGVVDSERAVSLGVGALRSIGVGWGFTVVRSELPSGPDHDLADEELWWESLSDDPEVFEGVRDLDLVDESHWAEALELLLHEPVTRRLVMDRDGYTAWWLRHHAVVAGVALGMFRAPDDLTFAGILDPFEHADAALSAVLAGDRVDDPELAQLMLERLADADRKPSPAVVVRTHRLLAEAVDQGRVDVEDLDLPPMVRSLSGLVTDPARAFVLDKHWLAAVLPHDRVVVGDLAGAEALSSILDIPLASDVVFGEVVGEGRETTWEQEPDLVLEDVVLGVTPREGAVCMHDELVVRCTGAVTGEFVVNTWVDRAGRTHRADRVGRKHRGGFDGD
ncbi:sacsin N-terminal ATP-binding-like domain-containing protein [Rhodococcus sp. NPDC058521]|uniref:sacsin N-terminal ATP-binding-like domain-containing protein n=1 Tax=Rhodococcus sp. NPDC058521 TaxID=3346536 RepID=UPI00365FB197